MNEQFNKEYFENSIKLFIQRANLEKESRYKSWEYCYSFFHSVFDEISSQKGITISQFLSKQFDKNNERWTYNDQLCLHLAFYMASWGMYRGSSFLLQNDYKIYKNVVSIIFNPKYKNLWKDKDLFSNDNSDLILELYKEIQNVMMGYKEFYDSKSYFLNKERESKDEYDSKFLTIITKILLGTIGCLPAFDRNFKYGYGLQTNPDVEKSIKDVYAKIASLRENAIYKLPIMKQFDMFYFSKGQDNYFLQDLGFSKNEFEKVTEEKIRNRIIEILSNKTENNKKLNDAAKFLANNIYKCPGSNLKYLCFIANPNIRAVCDNNKDIIGKFVNTYYKPKKDYQKENF